METFWHDLKYGARQLRRAPGFTATVAITFALGVGANTAVFSFVDRLLLRAPAGVSRPAEIRRLYTDHPEFRMMTIASSVSQRTPYPAYVAIRSQLGSLASIAAYDVLDSVPAGRREVREPVRAAYADTDYFTLLGVRPSRGRFFQAEDDRPV